MEANQFKAAQQRILVGEYILVSCNLQMTTCERLQIVHVTKHMLNGLEGNVRTISQTRKFNKAIEQRDFRKRNSEVDVERDSGEVPEDSKDDCKQVPWIF